MKTIRIPIFSIQFKKLLSYDDYVILYRIINKCGLAKIDKDDVENLIVDDMASDVTSYQFVIYNSYDLRLAQEMIKTLLPNCSLHVRMVTPDRIDSELHDLRLFVDEGDPEADADYHEEYEYWQEEKMEPAVRIFGEEENS